MRIIRAVTEGASSTAEVAGESMAAVDAGVRAVLAAANELREAKRAAAAAASAAAAPKPAAGEAAATATGDAPAADAGSSSSAAGGDDDGGDDGDAEGWQTLGGGRRHGGGGGGGGKGALRGTREDSLVRMPLISPPIVISPLPSTLQAQLARATATMPRRGGGRRTQRPAPLAAPSAGPGALSPVASQRRAGTAASVAHRASGGPARRTAARRADPTRSRRCGGAAETRGRYKAEILSPWDSLPVRVQRAAAAKFHKTVVMPEPALLAVVVGVRGRTVFRISDEAGVTMVTNRDAGALADGEGCASTGAVVQRALLRRLVEPPPCPSPLPPPPPAAGSLTIHGDSMEAISHAEGLVAEVVAHAQAKGRPPPSPEGSSGGPREGRRGRPDNSAAHGPHQH